MDISTATVRIGYVRALLDYLQAHDIDPRPVFSLELLAGLETPSLNQRLPVLQWGQLLDAAIAHTGDPALPLRMAVELTPKHWGVFAYAAMTCKNLAEVVQILARYERLIDEANDTALVALGDKVGLQWIPRMQVPSVALIQLSLASWAVFARRYTERPDLQADADFTFPAPTDIAPYASLFGGRVRFDQPVNQLILPHSYLQLAITHHDADTHRVLLSQAQSQIEALNSETDIQARLRRAVSQRLSSGRITLEHLAEAMEMAPRTLQYQLEAAGTSYRQLLDDIRTDLAHFYLSDPHMALVDVAFLLGYSEQSPFNKAFKRWTGETPGEYRKRIR